jgi:hypothetical protein
MKCNIPCLLVQTALCLVFKDKTMGPSLLIKLNTCMSSFFFNKPLKNLLQFNATFSFQVTHTGISDLASKNPSIETLIMSNCHNITDDGVISCVKHLARLKHLELQVYVTLNMSFLQGSGILTQYITHLAKVTTSYPTQYVNGFFKLPYKRLW